MAGDNRDGIAAEDLLRRTFAEEGCAGSDAKSSCHKYPTGRAIGTAQLLDHAQRRDRVSLSSAETFR